MSNQHNIKQKLKVLNTSACQQIICDVLKEIGIAIDEEGISDEMYGRAAKGIVRDLRMQYKSGITVADVVSKQVDLEDTIAEVKEKELEKWKSGNLNNYKDGRE